MVQSRQDGTEVVLDPVLEAVLGSELKLLSDSRFTLGASATAAALNGNEYPDEGPREGMPRGFFALLRTTAATPDVETWGAYSEDENTITLNGVELKGAGYLTVFVRDGQEGGRELVVARERREDRVLPVSANDQTSLEVAKLAVAEAAQDYLNNFTRSMQARGSGNN